MSNLFPVLVISHRDSADILCGRGCNCYQGTVRAKYIVKTCNTPEELIEHIAQLDFDTFQEWTEYRAFRDERKDFSHYIVSQSSAKVDYSSDSYDLAPGIVIEDSTWENSLWLKEAVAKRMNDLTAGEKAKEEEKKRKEAEEERQRQVLAQLEKERHEKAEYERLKAKFETSKIETK